MSVPVKGRFAPSPSGQMHLGNAFAALLAWLSARAQGGRMLLRIEDLDPARSRPQYIEGILRDLDWLGLDWDEGYATGGDDNRFLQSCRTGFYEQQLQILSTHNPIYRCYCTRAELHAAAAPHASDGQRPYDGRCRSLTAQQLAGRALPHPGALRIQVPGEVIGFTDGCQGYYEENLATATGDFILRRSDGVFAYQLAAPADDGDMGVTEVVRGRDLLASTPRQIWLMRQLGHTPPAYFHVPLLLAADGRRLSKRDADLDLAALRARQPDPQPLIGTLAHLAGLLPQPQPVSAAALLPLFRWDKIRRDDICLTPAQIDAFNEL